MLADAIKSRLSAAPFRPFVLRLASGAEFKVAHPELVSPSPGGRHLILWVGDNRYVDLDVLLIESIGQNGNGHRRKRST